MRVFAFAAAHRRESLDRKLVRLAVAAAERAGAIVDLADFHEFDWASRVSPYAWRGKPGMLLSLVGGNRSLWAPRVPASRHVLAREREPGVRRGGALEDAKLASRFEKIVAEFLGNARALATTRASA